jgi:cytochrome P450
MSLISGLERLAGGLGAEVERFVKEGKQELERHVEEHPQPLFALLRMVRPVLLIHDIAIVTRYDDVVEVLGNDQAFGVEPYASKMLALTGNFILGLDDSPQYERTVSILRLAAPRSDVSALAAFTNETAQELVSLSASSGRIDVVDISRRLPARLMGRWFGTPGPSEDAMIAWAMAMFEDIFANLKNDPVIHASAKRAGTQLLSYVRGQVAERKRTVTPGENEDVLGRLIAMQSAGETAFTDEEIVTNLIGLLVGFIPTVASTTTLAIDALMDRPEALAAAQQAAQADDDEAVRAHMWEAMRLAPQGPGLLRRALVDFVVAEGSHHATRIPAGTIVFAATESAMLDGAVLDDPEDFRVPRPAHDYLHFGAGMHECFGRFANELQIPAIAKAILRLPSLVRAPGEEGKLVKQGPYPKSLLLDTDATAMSSS